MTDSTKPTDAEFAAEFSAALRTLAAILDKNPELAAGLSGERVVVGTERVDKVEWRCPALADVPVAAGSAVAS